MILTEREIHLKTIEVFGETAMINKLLEEMSELTRELNDYKYGLTKDVTKILGERVDVGKMLDKLDLIFSFEEKDKKEVGLIKMRRTASLVFPGKEFALQFQ